MYPTKFYISSGFGIDEFPLVSFDSALINARIANYNLIKISSILPIGCRLSEEIDLIEGSPLLTAYGTISSNRIGETIASSVAVGIPEKKDSVGIIMEYSGVCKKKDAEIVVRKMVEKAMINHGLPFSTILSSSIDVTVDQKKTFTVISAISLW